MNTLADLTDLAVPAAMILGTVAVEVIRAAWRWIRRGRKPQPETRKERHDRDQNQNRNRN